MLRKSQVILCLSIMLISCEPIKDENFGDFRRWDDCKSYKNIYNQAEDSLKNWINDSLGVTQICQLYPYKLNKLIIFNTDSTRLFTTINISNTKDRKIPADVIKDFGGAKVNGRWYFFFMGVSEPIDRAYWQDSLYAPLTFKELSYVAYELRFKGLVKNIKEGLPEKNEEIFNNVIFSELLECKGLVGDKRKACEDSMILESARGKYNDKLNYKEITDLQKSIEDSKIPEGKPLVERHSWWINLLRGEKTFESKEWKEYLHNKHGGK